jgi:hypothetical protein
LAAGCEEEEEKEKEGELVLKGLLLYTSELQKDTCALREAMRTVTDR